MLRPEEIDAEKFRNRGAGEMTPKRQTLARVELQKLRGLPRYSTAYEVLRHQFCRGFTEAERRGLYDPCGTCGIRHDPGATEDERGDECAANRAVCYMPHCERVTCAQAIHNKAPPLCLDHYFGQAHRQLHILCP